MEMKQKSKEEKKSEVKNLKAKGKNGKEERWAGGGEKRRKRRER